MHTITMLRPLQLIPTDVITKRPADPHHYRTDAERTGEWTVVARQLVYDMVRIWAVEGDGSEWLFAVEFDTDVEIKARGESS